MLIGLGIVAIVFVVSCVLFFVFFVSRRFSPIPYFPSNHADVATIIAYMNLQKNMTVYDLGAGDGVVVLEAARTSRQRGLNTRFVAVEINPLLVALMYFRRAFHPAGRAIDLVRNDIFVMNFPNAGSGRKPPLFFMYISPWYMEKTVANIARQYNKFELVTYFYALPRSKKYSQKLQKSTKNIHSIYRYTVTRTSATRLR